MIRVPLPEVRIIVSIRCFINSQEGELFFPAISVNGCEGKSKLGNSYGGRHPLLDGIMRATDVTLRG